MAAVSVPRSRLRTTTDHQSEETAAAAAVAEELDAFSVEERMEHVTATIGRSDDGKVTREIHQAAAVHEHDETTYEDDFN